MRGEVEERRRVAVEGEEELKEEEREREERLR